MNDNLPALPEPWITDTEESGTREDGESIFVDIPLFTEEQIREYGQLCRQQALEAAAKVCDDFSGRPDINYSETCAVFIRSLK